MNGSLGASYWREKSDQTYWFSPNEQNMFHLFFDPSYLIMPDGQPYSVEALPQIPQLGGLGGMPLPINHEEENYSNAKNQAAEIFLDISHELTKRIFFNGGVRGVYDWNKLESEATFIGGSESTLGMLTGNYPNLFFKPSETKEIKNKGFSYTWRAGLKFKFNENANLFANYSIGRRPNVLQFTSAGEPEILDAENVINYDAGFKTHILTRILFDVVGFYQEYTDFQTSAWIADPTSGEFNYKVKNGGQATAYGAEANLKIAVIKGLDLYGNYAWLNATFDDTDKSGAKQEYAGNRFRLAPEHSFSAGMNASANITPDILFFINPSYSYKSQIYFEDANTPGLEQEAYGTLNVNGGLELDNPNIILPVFGTNLLNEQFVISAGNTGSLFGVPTFVPGAPKMIGTKLTWKF